MVDINGTLLIQILNFIVLCAMLGHLCYSAAKSRDDASRLKASYESQLKDAQIKADEIVRKAVKEAEVQAQAQIQAAHDAIEKE